MRYLNLYERGHINIIEMSEIRINSKVTDIKGKLIKESNEYCKVNMQPS